MQTRLKDCSFHGSFSSLGMWEAVQYPSLGELHDHLVEVSGKRIVVRHSVLVADRIAGIDTHVESLGQREGRNVHLGHLDLVDFCSIDVELALAARKRRLIC